ncbi:beta-ketoacyl-[acyl-carrier-protein] synthase family protein [Yinghuangia seranimata]|uniref:beta-ketoacyl-[acyl-carrier-protein] synthase family protein n=1 Tax=Yinghuangia seranimata TaxID=408067 RepID=UPI00248B3E89|nr:beta-ketoacyl synthase N-terminal-like domain-containing protein [Yinghuangia seranimata]MDI2125663.1 beta-ketoacyl synthase N-terminal-like domain-containing protein [Yinghuangia seranimata]
MTRPDRRRAVLTGLGAVSCLGAGVDAYGIGLLAGGAAPHDVDLPHMNMRAKRMYLTPPSAIPVEPVAHAGIPLGPAPRMAVAAAREALADAGIGDGEAARVPVVMGVEMGNASVQEEQRASGGGTPRWTPLAVTAAVVAEAVGSRAGASGIGNACAAGGYALGVALDMIRAGEADVVLVGGAEGVTRVGMAGFDRIRVTDPDRCRPFARDRAGTVFADGAAFAVLESADHAAARGAWPYAELGAAVWSCDSYHHPTAPEPDGVQLVRAMRDALADAGVRPDQVGCVLPHATGTLVNDAVESRALRRVFADVPDRPPVFALKALIGHGSGTAGMFACLAGALIASHGRIPANAPVDQDPECDVWLPQDGPLALTRPAVLVNSCATGGINASFVLSYAGGRA